MRGGGRDWFGGRREGRGWQVRPDGRATALKRQTLGRGDREGKVGWEGGSDASSAGRGQKGSSLKSANSSGFLLRESSPSAAPDMAEVARRGRRTRSTKMGRQGTHPMNPKQTGRRGKEGEEEAERLDESPLARSVRGGRGRERGCVPRVLQDDGRRRRRECGVCGPAARREQSARKESRRVMGWRERRPGAGLARLVTETGTAAVWRRGQSALSSLASRRQAGNLTAEALVRARAVSQPWHSPPSLSAGLALVRRRPVGWPAESGCRATLCDKRGVAGSSRSRERCERARKKGAHRDSASAHDNARRTGVAHKGRRPTGRRGQQRRRSSVGRRTSKGAAESKALAAPMSDFGI